MKRAGFTVAALSAVFGASVVGAHTGGPTVVIVEAGGTGANLDVTLARAELVGRIPSLAAPDPAQLESWTLVRAAVRDAVSRRISVESADGPCAVRWRGPVGAGPDRLRLTAEVGCGRGRAKWLRVRAGDTAEQRTIVDLDGEDGGLPPRVILGSGRLELAPQAGGGRLLGLLVAHPELPLAAALVGVAALTPAAAWPGALWIGAGYGAGRFLAGPLDDRLPPGWLAAALLLLVATPLASRRVSGGALLARMAVGAAVAGLALADGRIALAAALIAAAAGLLAWRPVGTPLALVVVALLAGMPDGAPEGMTDAVLATAAGALGAGAVAIVAAGLSMRLPSPVWARVTWVLAALLTAAGFAGAAG